MLAIDLVVGLLIAVAAFAGSRLGLERALPVAGVAAGVLLGSRVPLLAGAERDSDYALNIAAVGAVVLGGLGAALGDAIGRRASGVGRRSLVLDTSLAALLTGAAAAVAVWALAPVVAEISAIRGDVRRSEVLDRFNAVLTPVSPPRDEPAVLAGQPRRTAPPKRKRPKAAGDPGLRSRPEVERAERSLVKIVTNRCGGGYQGTGWIAGHGMVVTNAHVVSAGEKVTVSVLGEGPPLAANVVWFDGIHDLALLRVGALRREPGLPLAADPKPSTQAVTLGFPSGKLTLRRARLDGTTDKLGRLPPLKLASKAGISLTMKNRLVTVIRGLSGPGGSGGPVVDRSGRVVATVFAGITQSDITLAVPNRIVRSALKRANHRVDVPSCNTPPLNPTREESIRARNA